MKKNKKEARLEINYVPGDTLDKCYLVATKGPIMTSVKVADLKMDDMFKDDKKPMAPEVKDPKDNKFDVKKPEGKGYKDVPMKELEEMLANLKQEKKIGQARIVAAELQRRAEALPDASKPKADGTHKPGDGPTQPSSFIKGLNGENLPDKSKPKADGTHKPGEGVTSPQALVKKFAEKAGNSILRLSNFWNYSKLHRRTQASLESTGDGVMAREPMAPPMAGKIPMAPVGKDIVAREPIAPSFKAPGTAGGETMKYWSGLGKSSLDTPMIGDQWARKVASLRKDLKSANTSIEKYKLKASILEQQLNKERKTALNHHKGKAIETIMSIVASSLIATDEEVMDLHERGLSMEDARVKAHSNAVDKKRASLNTHSLDALREIEATIKGVNPVQKIASKDPLDNPKNMPAIYNEDIESSSIEQRLSDSWPNEDNGQRE